MTPPAAGRFDSFAIRLMQRSELKNAPYNPRIMGEKELVKLRAGIERHGMLEPPVWNERTGNLVGGHQRLRVLDAIAGTKDYQLQVAVVHLDDTREREANILLNNTNAQGDWDLALLDSIFKSTPDIELDGTGFDAADIYKLLGDVPGPASNTEELADALRQARERYAGQQTEAANRDGSDFYLVLVFKDEAHRDEFAKALGLDENRYQDGRTILRLIQGKQE